MSSDQDNRVPKSTLHNDTSPDTKAATPTPSDFKAAYEYLRPRLSEKPQEELGRFALEGALVVQRLLGVCHELEPYQEEILMECPRLDPDLFTELRLAVFALGHAEALKRAASGVPTTDDDPTRQVRTARATLKADLEPLVVRGLLARDALTLSQGNSPRGIAFDVLRLATHMDQHATALQGRVWTTPAELARARAAAQKLLEFAGAKAQSNAEEEASLMYLRALSHVAELYEEVRWATVYTRRKFGDADKLAPSIYSMRAQRGPTKQSTAEDETTEDSTQEGGMPNTQAAGVDLNHLDELMNRHPSEVVPPGSPTVVEST